MREFISFLICIGASTLGAISGFGGGVMIKPLLDSTGFFPASTVSFLSGCTVLAMSLSSTIRGRKNGTKLEVSTSIPLAIGSAAGGVAGGRLLAVFKTAVGHENRIGLIQAAVLSITVIAVFIYVLKKERFRAYRIKNIFAVGAVGIAAGLLSAFLGIGGGPINIAMLQLCFSMDTKTASKCSIFIILFSQTASLVASVIAGTVPVFPWTLLLAMILGGVGGAVLGGKFSQHMSNQHVDKLVLVLLIFVLFVNIRNIIWFSTAA